MVLFWSFTFLKICNTLIFYFLGISYLCSSRYWIRLAEFMCFIVLWVRVSYFVSLNFVTYSCCFPLQEATSAFPELKQSESLKPTIKPLSDSLVRHGLLLHKDKDIRLLVGICFCEIIRILAPNPDFSDAVFRVKCSVYIISSTFHPWNHHYLLLLTFFWCIFFLANIFSSKFLNLGVGHF